MPKMTDCPKIRFQQLRETLKELRNLIESFTTDVQGNDGVGTCEKQSPGVDAFKEEIQSVMKNLDNQFETMYTQMEENCSKLVKGQTSMQIELGQGQRVLEDGLTRVEQMMRQISADRTEQDLRSRDLENNLATEQKVNEQLLKELSAKESEIAHLKKRLQDAEVQTTTLKQMRESMVDLTNQMYTLRDEATQAQATGFGSCERFKSLSCDDLSCYTLNSQCEEMCENENGLDCVPAALRRSQTTITTKDTGYSETVSDTTVLTSMNEKIDQLLKLATEFKETPTHNGPPLPAIIRGFCVNIQDAVVSSDRSRLNQFSRSLRVDEGKLQLQNCQQDLPSLFWDVISAWNRQCEDKAIRATMLNQLLQACDDCRIQNPLSVRPMPTRDRLIVESVYSYLVQHLMVPLTLSYLRDSQSLTSSIVNYVQEPDEEPDKVLRFVDILPVCGERALDIFVDALRKSDQNHIADKIAECSNGRFHVTSSPSCYAVGDGICRKFESRDVPEKKKNRFTWRRFFKSRKYSVNQH